jgi:hypothetical protein
VRSLKTRKKNGGGGGDQLLDDLLLTVMDQVRRGSVMMHEGITRFAHCTTCANLVKTQDSEMAKRCKLPNYCDQR